MGAHTGAERDDGFLRQPSHLDTEEDRVWFRTSNERYPTNVFVIWDGGDPVAISVASHAQPDGMGVLTSLEDARDMRDALTEIITRAEQQGFLTARSGPDPAWAKGVRDVIVWLRAAATAAPMWEWADAYADEIRRHVLGGDA